MIKLELEIEEIQVLREIVESDMEDLRVEIVSTDRLEFKEALKNRKTVLGSVLEKLDKSMLSQYSRVN